MDLTRAPKGTYFANAAYFLRPETRDYFRFHDPAKEGIWVVAGGYKVLLFSYSSVTNELKYAVVNTNARAEFQMPYDHIEWIHTSDLTRAYEYASSWKIAPHELIPKVFARTKELTAQLPSEQTVYPKVYVAKTPSDTSTELRLDGIDQNSELWMNGAKINPRDGSIVLRINDLERDQPQRQYFVTVEKSSKTATGLRTLTVTGGTQTRVDFASLTVVPPDQVASETKRLYFPQAKKTVAARMGDRLVLFSDPSWCGPCETLKNNADWKRFVERSARTYGGAVETVVTPHDAFDDNQDRFINKYSSQLKVSTVPTLVVLDEHGQERFRKDGLPEILEFVNSSLTASR